MKIIAYLFGLFLCVTIVGCEEPYLLKIPPEEPIGGEKMVTINAIAGANGTIDPSGISKIKLGDSKTYVVKADSGYSVSNVKIDGVSLTLNTLVIASDTIVVKTMGLVEGQTREVKVEFIFTDRLVLTKEPLWSLKSMKYIQGGLVVDEWNLNDDQKAKRYQFKLDGKVFVNGEFSCNWKFDEANPGHILIGDQYYTYTLKDNEFVRNIESLYDSKPAIFEVTYWRP